MKRLIIEVVEEKDFNQSIVFESNIYSKCMLFDLVE